MPFFSTDISRYQRLSDRVRNYGKITGIGFFEIDQATLSVMAEICLTYVIVLAQTPA